jgi:hypothetical protein
MIKNIIKFGVKVFAKDNDPTYIEGWCGGNSTYNSFEDACNELINLKRNYSNFKFMVEPYDE